MSKNKSTLSESNNNDEVNNLNPVSKLFNLIRNQESDLEGIRDLMNNNPELLTHTSTDADAIGSAIHYNKYSFIEILLEYCQDYTESNHFNATFHWNALAMNEPLMSIFLNKLPIANASHQLANRDTAEYFNNYKQLIINSDKALGFMPQVLAQIVWEFSTIPYIDEDFNIAFPIGLSMEDSAVIAPVTIHLIEADEAAPVIGNVSFPTYNDADWA